MSSPLPENSSQLRWMLGIRLGLAATVVALLAGGVAYSVETYRAEQAALEQAPAAPNISPRLRCR